MSQITRGRDTKSQIRVRLDGVCDHLEVLEEDEGLLLLLLLLRLNVSWEGEGESEGVEGESRDAALVGEAVGGGKAEG